MSRRTLLAALAALSLGVGGPAVAKDHDHGGPDGKHGGKHGDARGWDKHDPGRHGGPPGGVPPGHRYDDRGPGGREYGDRGWHDRGFHRGERLPPDWRHRQYVVDDWRGHRLRPPPRGYQWVQAGGEYLLVAIPTGLIVQVVIGN